MSRQIELAARSAPWQAGHAMFPVLISVLVGISAGAGNHNSYDNVEHPPSWYDRSIRSIDAVTPGSNGNCVDRLNKAGIKFRLLAGVKGVETPVEILDRSLGLVVYKRGPLATRRFILDCHTVEVLASLGRRLRKAGIATVYWSSAWRYSYRKGTTKLSAHAHGTALDVVAIDGKFGYATVKGHYEKGMGDCGDNTATTNSTSKNSTKNASTKAGRSLRRFRCAMIQNYAFATVYSPDTDAIHADHLHFEGPDAAIKYAPRHPAKPRWFMHIFALVAVVVFAIAGYWWWKSDSKVVEKQ